MSVERTVGKRSRYRLVTIAGGERNKRNRPGRLKQQSTGRKRSKGVKSHNNDLPDIDSYILANSASLGGGMNP